MSEEKEAKIQPSIDTPLQPVENEPPVAKNKGGRPAGLTVKARCFLELLVAGKKTPEAYRLAGYEGTDDSAYHLRSVLREQLYELLKARGMSREGILLDLKALKEAPSWEEQAGIPLKFDQKLALLKFLAKLTPEKDMTEKPTVTPFLLNIQNAEEVSVTTQGESKSEPSTEDLA